MAAPTKQRFYNISGFKYGVTDEYNTIKDISTDEPSNFITDSGDTDTAETVLGKGVSAKSFTISISDPIQAQAILNHAKADITFQGVAGGSGGTNVLVTIAGAVVGGRSQRAPHNGVYTTQLSGRCDNVTVALAS